MGGQELFFRPEVFAHTLRAAKKHGFGVTYHVGEDFYDIVDGMRAVWEVIKFTESYPVDRLGHCMALGMQAKHYYSEKMFMQMPAQVMLDNIVWLCCFAKEKGIRIRKSLYDSLKVLAEDLYVKIGFDKEVETLDMQDYYVSMFLRSDERCADDGLDVWTQTALLDTGQADKARENKI